MRSWLRWLLIPVACVASWYLALFVGMVVYALVESLCPRALVVSGACTAWWFPYAQAAAIAFGVALGAFLMVASAFFIAPARRSIAAWVVFGLGVVFALVMAVPLRAWIELGAAIGCGFLTALTLTRRKVGTRGN